MDEKDILLQVKDYIDLSTTTMDTLMERFEHYDTRLAEVEESLTKVVNMMLELKQEHEVLVEGFNDIKGEMA